MNTCLMRPQVVAPELEQGLGKLERRRQDQNGESPKWFQEIQLKQRQSIAQSTRLVCRRQQQLKLQLQLQHTKTNARLQEPAMPPWPSDASSQSSQANPARCNEAPQQAPTATCGVVVIVEATNGNCAHNTAAQLDVTRRRAEDKLIVDNYLTQQATRASDAGAQLSASSRLACVSLGFKAAGTASNSSTNSSSLPAPTTSSCAHTSDNSSWQLVSRNSSATPPLVACHSHLEPLGKTISNQKPRQAEERWSGSYLHYRDQHSERSSCAWPSLEQQLRSLLAQGGPTQIEAREREQPTLGTMKKAGHCGQQDCSRHSTSRGPGRSTMRGSQSSADDRMIIFMLASKSTSTSTNSSVERNARILKWLNNCRSAV